MHLNMSVLAWNCRILNLSVMIYKKCLCGLRNLRCSCILFCIVGPPEEASCYTNLIPMAQHHTVQPQKRYPKELETWKEEVNGSTSRLNVVYCSISKFILHTYNTMILFPFLYCILCFPTLPLSHFCLGRLSMAEVYMPIGLKFSKNVWFVYTLGM